MLLLFTAVASTFVFAADPSIPDNHGLFDGTEANWPSEYELAFYGMAT